MIQPQVFNTLYELLDKTDGEELRMRNYSKEERFEASFKYLQDILWDQGEGEAATRFKVVVFFTRYDGRW